MWLLKQDVAAELMQARRVAFSPPPDALAAFTAMSNRSASAAMPDIMRVAGGTAEIRVEGVLTPGPSFIAWLFGGGNTSYDDIREALAVASADPSIKRAAFYIDSPGGRVDGLFETLEAIKSFSKPVTVRAACACSAAYAIAAAAGKIEAVGPASEFGSIGVAVTLMQDDSLIDITSTEAPDKRPDISTPEGQAVVRRHLDAIHELFVEAIADGRGVKPKDVNADYGRGGVMLAREAKRAGLIDKLPAQSKPRGRASTDADMGDDVSAHSAIITQSDTSAASSVEGAQPTGPSNGPVVTSGMPSLTPTSMNAPHTAAANQRKVMNQEELRAQHPELFAAVFNAGKAEGMASGATEALAKEQDRVKAHLVMGEQSGDMKLALSAIREGAPMTQELTAKYMTAGMARADQSARQAETKDAAAVVAGAETVEPDAKDEVDQVADALDAMHGKSVK